MLDRLRGAAQGEKRRPSLSEWHQETAIVVYIALHSHRGRRTDFLSIVSQRLVVRTAPRPSCVIQRSWISVDRVSDGPSASAIKEIVDGDTLQISIPVHDYIATALLRSWETAPLLWTRNTKQKRWGTNASLSSPFGQITGAWPPLLLCFPTVPTPYAPYKPRWALPQNGPMAADHTDEVGSITLPTSREENIRAVRAFPHVQGRL
jgi:hypothetical protein